MKLNQGFIQTPNWPGEYPINSQCVWDIHPPKGRRILIVIPEIYLESRDRCGDSLVMRKSGKYTRTQSSSKYTCTFTFHSRECTHVHMTLLKSHCVTAASKYSVTTYESCEAVDTPRAITAYSKKLWAQFTSDGEHTAQGFSIPYVMYNGETVHDVISSLLV